MYEYRLKHEYDEALHFMNRGKIGASSPIFQIFLKYSMFYERKKYVYFVLKSYENTEETNPSTTNLVVPYCQEIILS